MYRSLKVTCSNKASCLGILPSVTRQTPWTQEQRCAPTIKELVFNPTAPWSRSTSSQFLASQTQGNKIHSYTDVSSPALLPPAMPGSSIQVLSCGCPTGHWEPGPYNLMTYDCNAEMELRLNYTGTCTESRSGCLITKDSISIAVFHYTT